MQAGGKKLMERKGDSRRYYGAEFLIPSTINTLGPRILSCGELPER